MPVTPDLTSIEGSEARISIAGQPAVPAGIGVVTSGSDTTSMEVEEPDPQWRSVDTNRHIHRWLSNGTVRGAVQSMAPCGWFHDPGDECAGIPQWRCVACDEPVTPGTRPTVKTFTTDRWWYVTVDAPLSAASYPVGTPIAITAGATVIMGRLRSRVDTLNWSAGAATVRIEVDIDTCVVRGRAGVAS